MSYIQCLSNVAYHQQHCYKLTHDVSLDSLNDLCTDNDIGVGSLHSPADPYNKSSFSSGTSTTTTSSTTSSSPWTNTGVPAHSNNVPDNQKQVDNDDFRVSLEHHVNANNVRNTEAHGQSGSSWTSACVRTSNGHHVVDGNACISDYISSSRTPAHGGGLGGGGSSDTAPCGGGGPHADPYYERSGNVTNGVISQNGSSIGAKPRRLSSKTESDDDVTTPTNSSAPTRWRPQQQRVADQRPPRAADSTRATSRTRTSACNSPEVVRRYVPSTYTARPTEPDPAAGSAKQEADTTSGGTDSKYLYNNGRGGSSGGGGRRSATPPHQAPHKSLEEELALASGSTGSRQALSNRSSPEEDQAPSYRSFSRQDSRASDSSYSDENCRRQSEDGSDGSVHSQRSVRPGARRTPRKGRRPRKLPEIPPSAKATAATITFMTASGALKSCSLTQLSNLLTEVRDNKETEFLQRSLSSVDRSLADELSEADPTLKLPYNASPPAGVTPVTVPYSQPHTTSTAAPPRSDCESSPDSNVEFEQHPRDYYGSAGSTARGSGNNRDRHWSGGSTRSNASKTESERDIMSMSTSTVGSTPGCDNAQGHNVGTEMKVRAEETARETLPPGGGRWDRDYHYDEDVLAGVSSPRHRQKQNGTGSAGASRFRDGAYGGSDPVFQEDAGGRALPPQQGNMKNFRMDSFDIASDRRSSVSSSLCIGVEDLDATHRGCHKFIPRHSDELFIEIGDPIAVQCEDDDLWCAGYNLRTLQYGIFPSAYATDLSILELDDGSIRPIKFIVRFLGSVEVTCHRGTEVLAQAINKVALAQRSNLKSSKPPPVVLLEVNEQGVKMSEKNKKKEKVSEKEETQGPMSPGRRAASIRARLAKIMAKEKDKSLDHSFSLKNISFCGYHPRNERYFAFITKHPLEMRFACHVFLSDHSTKTIAEAVGNAFRQFYSQYMAFVHPTEDIYIE